MAPFSVIHLRDLVLFQGLVVFKLYPPCGARRSARIGDIRYDADQQSNTFANSLDMSTDAREALLPRGFTLASLRRADLRPHRDPPPIAKLAEPPGSTLAVGGAAAVDYPVLLVDNGSKRPEATLALRETAAALSTLLGRAVRPCSLAFSDEIPAAELGGNAAVSLRAAILALAKGGARGAVLVPLFLGPSEGLRRGVADCARAVAEVVGEGNFDLRVSACLVDENEPGDDRLGRALAAEVLHVAQRARLREPVKVLVVDHGTPSPRVHAVRERLVDEVRSLLGDRALDVRGASMERRDASAYDFNEPLLERALTEPPFDNGDVIVALQFLLPGRHAGEDGDVAKIVECACKENRGRLRVHTTQLLGKHPLVLSVLAERAMPYNLSSANAPG